MTAREEERRRLRRDLHDGVGPQLAALTLKIETARNKLSHDPAADALLSDLAGRAHEAVADVRRSVHALRPPVLDELGLVPALRETAAQYGGNALDVSVRASENLPPLPAAVAGRRRGRRLPHSPGGDDQRRPPRRGQALQGEPVY